MLNKKSQKRNSFLAFFFFAITIVALNGDYSLNKKSDAFLRPPKYMKNFTFGFNDSISDFLWLRYIQDMELCNSTTMSQSDFKKEYKLDNNFDPSLSKENIFKVESSNTKKNVCFDSWAYYMLDAITEVTPKFRLPYVLGATNLSVIVEDHIGAKKIFDKAIIQFPKDWSIVYKAAYHNFYELRDYSRAAELMSRAGDLGAPWWVKSLASKFHLKEGQYALGIVVLEDYYKKLKKEKAKEKVRARIKNLRELIKKSKSKKKSKATKL